MAFRETYALRTKGTLINIPISSDSCDRLFAHLSSWKPSIGPLPSNTPRLRAQLALAHDRTHTAPHII